MCSWRAAAENASTLYAGELEIRLGEGLVLATGRALTLSVREFELLVAMARRAGAIVTREELYSAVWGGELRPGDRSVDVYVSKLRGKLEAAMPDRRFIHTHPGFGYRFQPQPAREPGAIAGAAQAPDVSEAAGARPGDSSGAPLGDSSVSFHEMFTTGASASDETDPRTEPAGAACARTLAGRRQPKIQQRRSQ